MVNLSSIWGIFLRIFATIIFLYLLFYVWWKFYFLRNPPRTIPEKDGILSPADGRIIKIMRLSIENTIKDNTKNSKEDNRGDNKENSKVNNKENNKENSKEITSESKIEAKLHIYDISGRNINGKNTSERDITNEIIINKGYFGKIKTIVNDILSKSNSKSVILISIFMSPLDVHYNRAPISGKIISQKHKDGTFHNAEHFFETLYNEKNEIIIESEENPNLYVKVIQIAGFLARRIESFVNVNDTLKRGQIYGRINLGSQVTLIIPEQIKENNIAYNNTNNLNNNTIVSNNQSKNGDTTKGNNRIRKLNILVKENDRVVAGETILCRFN